MAGGERLLLCSVGAGNYAETGYRLGADAWRTRFAPVALARLGGLAGARCLVLVTAEARAKWLDAFAAEMRDAGLDVDPLDVPLGRSEAEVLDIFARIAGAVPEGARVTLDVTFALRHLPFVYLASLAYLVGQRGVAVDGIFYGAFEVADADGTRPILDITSLFELLRWYQALEDFRNSGDATSLSRQFKDERERLRGLGWAGKEMRNTGSHIEKLSRALTAGLPLEAGRAAFNLVNETKRIDAAGVPEVLRLSVASLRELAKTFAVERETGKAALALNEAELERQRRLVRWYAGRGDAPRALLLLREWMVSVAVLGRRDADRWLDFQAARRPAEWFFGGLLKRVELGVASAREKKVGRVWKEIADARNQFAHAGMRKDDVDAGSAVAQLVERCVEARADVEALAAAAPAPRRLLLTGLGMSPGAVATALACAEPDAVLVVTSAAAEAGLAAAIEHSGRSGIEHRVLRLEDAYGDFDAAGRFATDRDLLVSFATAGELVANLTGGTSAMQFVVEKLASTADRMGVRVRRCLLVDRRTPEEQRAEPWVRGELVWLDDRANGEGTE